MPAQAATSLKRCTKECTSQKPTQLTLQRTCHCAGAWLHPDIEMSAPSQACLYPCPLPSSCAASWPQERYPLMLRFACCQAPASSPIITYPSCGLIVGQGAATRPDANARCRGVAANIAHPLRCFLDVPSTFKVKLRRCNMHTYACVRLPIKHAWNIRLVCIPEWEALMVQQQQHCTGHLACSQL